VLISFSGLDGSGKTTLIEALKSGLEGRHYTVTVLTMYDDIALYAFVRACCNGMRRLVRRGPGRRPTSAGELASQRSEGGALGLVRQIVYGIARHPASRVCVLPLDVLIFLARSVYERRIRGRVLITGP